MLLQLLSIERPTFNDITIRLQVIDLNSVDPVSQESLDDDIEPQPPIRLSYHIHQSGSLSQASLLQSVELPHPKETSV